MVLMGNSGARGTLIYEKNLMSKISCQTPFKDIILAIASVFLYDMPVPLVDGEDGISVDVGALELILITIDSLS